MEPCGLMELGRRSGVCPKPSASTVQAPLSLAGLLIFHKRNGSSAIGGHVFQLVTQPLSQVIQDAQLRRFIVQQRTAEMMYDFGQRG